jgi:hypothetical protein
MPLTVRQSCWGSSGKEYAGVSSSEMPFYSNSFLIPQLHLNGEKAWPERAGGFALGSGRHALFACLPSSPGSVRSLNGYA